jgi:hypothetical protein
MKHASTRLLASLAALGAPLAALAIDYPIAARTQLLRQDPGAGHIAKSAKIVSKPSTGVFTMPSQSPATAGATLRFFKAGSPGPWTEVDLPAAQWTAMGNPPGSKGYKYRGIGTVADPCRSVQIRPKVIKAVCRGAGAFDSPTPYSLPVDTSGANGAAFELVVGGDRYCALSSDSTLAQVKRNDGPKGIFKAIRAGSPASCPSADGTPTPTPTPAPSPTPTPTPPSPYGSASKAFLEATASLLE